MTGTSINQIILFVRDMAKEVHFYRDIMGLELRFPGAMEDYSNALWVEFDAGGCSLALHGGADEAPSQQHQIVFRVDDLERTRNELLNAGIEIGEIRLLEDGKPAAKGIDPEGHPFTIR